MDSEELKARTKRFGLEALRLVDSLPRTRSADALCRQLVRSATSVGANYRAACRARSNNEFVSKLGIVEEEADESMFWLELILDHGLGDKKTIDALLSECEQLLRITVASIKTARGK